VDQYSILNVVYSNKKKDYAKLKELVDSIHEVGLKETSYTEITFAVSAYYSEINNSINFLLCAGTHSEMERS
jgi:hypothetical protein